MLLNAAIVLNALRWEWFRLRRRVGVAVIFGLLLVGAVVQLAAQTWLSRAEFFAAGAYDYPVWLMTSGGNVGIFAAVMLAGIVFGGDFAAGAWRTLTARGTARWQAALAKLLLLALTLTVLLTAVWILGAIVGLLAAPGAGPDGRPDNPGLPAIGTANSWTLAFGSLGAAGLTLLAYVGLGSVLTVATRSAAFGIAVGIAIILAESIVYAVAGAIAGLVWEVDLSYYTRWTLSGATGALFRGDDDLSRWVFVAPALGYAGLCWGLTLAALERRDLPGGGGG